MPVNDLTKTTEIACIEHIIQLTDNLYLTEKGINELIPVMTKSQATREKEKKGSKYPAHLYSEIKNILNKLPGTYSIVPHTSACGITQCKILMHPDTNPLLNQADVIEFYKKMKIDTHSVETSPLSPEEMQTKVNELHCEYAIKTLSYLPVNMIAGKIIIPLLGEIKERYSELPAEEQTMEIDNKTLFWDRIKIMIETEEEINWKNDVL
jgi:hypothetical protein